MTNIENSSSYWFLLYSQRYKTDHTNLERVRESDSFKKQKRSNLQKRIYIYYIIRARQPNCFIQLILNHISCQYHEVLLINSFFIFIMSRKTNFLRQKSSRLALKFLNLKKKLPSIKHCFRWGQYQFLTPYYIFRAL